MKIEPIYTGCLAQGVGSACGKNMRKETTDTLGNQKKTMLYIVQEVIDL